jgi:HEAT repeat protein
MFFRCLVFIIIHLLFFINFSFADDLLINSLSQDDWESRLLNQASLEDLRKDEKFNKLLSIVKNEGIDWRLRIRVIKIFGLMDDNKTIPYLIEIFEDLFLNDDCPAIRYYAALALGNYKDKRVTEALLNSINDSEILVREAVVHSLGKTGDKDVLPYLINALNDKSFAVRRASLRAIEELGDRLAIESLKNFVKNVNDDILKKEAENIIEKFLR